MHEDVQLDASFTNTVVEVQVISLKLVLLV